MPQTPLARGNPFTREAREELYAPKPAEIGDNIAANRAHQEAMILRDPESYSARKQIQKRENIVDEAILLANSNLEAQGLANTGDLSAETPFASPEDRLAAVQHNLLRLDYRNVDKRGVLAATYVLAGAVDVSLEVFEQRLKEVTIVEADDLRDKITKHQLARGEQDVNELVAAQGWDNMWDALTDVMVQDFTPGWNVLTRIGLNRKLLQAALGEKGMKELGWKGFFPGEIRQAIREFLVKGGPEARNLAIQAMTEMVDSLQRDPRYSKYLTNYAVLEAFEGIFTPEVLQGDTPKNTLDRWFGNLEIGLEAVFTAMTVAKAGKTMKGVFRSPEAVRLRQLHHEARNNTSVANIDEQIHKDQLHAEFELDNAEVATAQYPRPETFVDEGSVDALTDGNKRTLAQSERQRSRILEITDDHTGRGLTPLDKTNAINQAYDDIDLADSMHIHAKMNTLRMLENENGFEITVNVGKTAETAYDDIAEVTADALKLDPELKQFNIMYVDETGMLKPLYSSPEEFQRAAFKGEVPRRVAEVGLGESPEFFIQYKHQRFWHTADKATLGTDAFLSGGVVPRTLLAPNAKFGDEIYGTFLTAYMDEQALTRNLEAMFKPFYQLGIKDKKFVSAAFEWSEDFGKNHGRAPTLSEMYTHYDGLTPKQVDGLIALRQGMDTMHELFNRRLYRDWQALGYKTARPNNTTLPAFHGEELSRGSVPGGTVEFLDPETGRMVKMTSRDIDDMYNAGGRVMKLDMPLDAANEARKKADLVIVREGTYEVGDLSTRPLKYHPGYSIRFYDDPYYVVKTTSNVSVNGAARAGRAGMVDEAIKTAGTQFEADDFVSRATARDARRGVEGTSYRVVRANDISNTESVLFQKQAIHREGRLFWDERNPDRLPDVNGNRARLEDPVQSVERGIGMAARQLTHEDPLKALKGAFENEFGDLIGPQAFRTKTLKQISDDLGAERKNITDLDGKKRYRKAKELVDYFRLVEGTESMLIPTMREAAINLAATIGRATSGKLTSRSLEKYLQTFDPLRTMRTVAFNAFMVFRPVRQAILQSMQISYLAGLDPKYVASPKFFKDAYMLRRGLTKLRNSAFDDGLSVKQAAKNMGLTQSEYRKLIKEFDRSGIIELVDVHSFAGGARKSQKVKLPNSPTGVVGYKAKQYTTGVKDFLQRTGFTFGERNNLTFTYNLALKRLKDKKGYESLLDLTRKDWNQVRVDASNLALGMVRPNNFGYQTGLFSVGTQFLSFSHKAMLGLMGANPAIKGMDVARIAGATYLLYGANMYGAREWVEETLKTLELEEWGNKNIPGIDGGTLVDLLAGGAIEKITNSLLDLTTDDYKDLDLSFLAPGVDFTRLWEMQLETLIKQPTKAVFGPFGNIFSKVSQSYDFISWYHGGSPDIGPADKFVDAAHAISMGLFPQYNDIVMSYIGYQMGLWVSASGDPLPLRPTWNGLIARAAFGGRTREEIGYYRLQNKKWDSEEMDREIIRRNQDHMVRLITLWGDGSIGPEEVRKNVQILTNLMEEFPEGRRQKILEDSILEDLENGDPSVHKQLVQMMEKRQVAPDVAALIDLFTDMPPEKREILKKLAKEVWETSKRVDVKTEEILREEQR